MDTQHQDIRDAIRSLCETFPPEYHRKVEEERGYPEAFVDALTEAGWLAAMIPEEYGGSGLGLTEAGVIMEEINRAGGNSGACHGQMYNMGTLLRHGSEEQKQRYLPRIASGELRLQSMGVTEPTTGTDTTKIKTTAVRKGDRYVVNGQKVWISRVQHSDLMILLARTTPLDQVKKKSEGMSIFLVDIKEALKTIDDMTAREKWIMAPLIFMTLLLGVYPALVIDVTGPSVENLLTNYHAAIGSAADHGAAAVASH